MTIVARGLGRPAVSTIVGFGLGRDIAANAGVNTDTTQGRSVFPFVPIRDVEVHLTKTFGAYGGTRTTAAEVVAKVRAAAKAAVDVQITAKQTGAVFSSCKVLVETGATAIASRVHARCGTGKAGVAHNVQVAASRHAVELGTRRTFGSTGSYVAVDPKGMLVGTRPVEVFTVLNPTDEELIAAYLAARRSRFRVRR